MGRLYLDYLEGRKVYHCSQCKVHLADREQIISKDFQGRTGKAYLFNAVANITVGLPEERNMITGRHTVADISCKCCRAVVGWTYLRAFEESQKYKEGKFIIEKAFLRHERSS